MSLSMIIQNQHNIFNYRKMASSKKLFFQNKIQNKVILFLFSVIKCILIVNNYILLQEKYPFINALIELDITKMICILEVK